MMWMDSPGSDLILLEFLCFGFICNCKPLTTNDKGKSYSWYANVTGAMFFVLCFFFFIRLKKQKRQDSFQCFQTVASFLGVFVYFVRNDLLWLIPVFWLINRENTCLSASIMNWFPRPSSLILSHSSLLSFLVLSSSVINDQVSSQFLIPISDQRESFDSLAKTFPNNSVMNLWFYHYLFSIECIGSRSMSMIYTTKKDFLCMWTKTIIMCIQKLLFAPFSFTSFTINFSPFPS